MADTFSGTIHDYEPSENKWLWTCGNPVCCARTNPPVAIKDRQRVTAVCMKCKAINQIARFK